MMGFTIVNNSYHAHCLTDSQANQEGFINWAFNDDPQFWSNVHKSALVRPAPDDKEHKNHAWDEPRISQRHPGVDLCWLEPKYRSEYLRLLKHENHDYELSYPKNTQNQREQKLYKSLSWGKNEHTSKKPGGGQNLNKSLPPKDVRPEGWWRIKEGELDMGDGGRKKGATQGLNKSF